MPSLCSKGIEMEKEFETAKVDIAVVLETKRNLKDHQK
jgi:hypothetical protein